MMRLAPEGGPAGDVLPDGGAAAAARSRRRRAVIANIRGHRYSGEDRSLLYKYALSPLAARLTLLVPRWVHPNAITLLGLLATAAGCAAVLATASLARLPWSAASVFPAWLHLFLGLCFFAYQTLDNMDGKQARRTGTSSPLGYVVDHGCDAINSTIGTLNLFVNLNVAACAGAPRRWAPLKQWLLWETVCVGFFVSTWEEFHTGSLVLPVVNGASEGLTLLSLLAAASAALGDAWWEEEAALARRLGAALGPLAGARNNTCIIALLSSAGAVTVLGQLARVYRAAGRAAGARRARAFGDLLPFFATNAMVLAWCATSPARIMETHSTLIFLLCGCFHSRLTILLMVSHVCGVAYRPLTPTTALTLAGLGAVLLLGGRLAAHAAFEPGVLAALLAANACGLLHLCRQSVRGLCFALGTSLFSGGGTAVKKAAVAAKGGTG